MNCNPFGNPFRDISACGKLAGRKSVNLEVQDQQVGKWLLTGGGGCDGFV